jgi:transcriptional regulator with XRE-family HTH domain
MNILREFSGMGTRPYPLDRERRRRVMIALAERDMSISGLARKIDIDQAVVSKVICGRRLSVKTEMRIAEYLGKPADYLFPKRSFEEIGQMRQAEAEEKERGKAA